MMIVTAEEASDKWCPHARYGLGIVLDLTMNGGLNRWMQSINDDDPHDLNPVPCRCIANECMMWSWVDDDMQICTKLLSDKHTRPKGDGWEIASETDHSVMWSRPHPHRRGSCGLAKRT